MNALTLTTAYSAPSIRLVTTGTAPQRLHTWKTAVPVPNEYFETGSGSFTSMRSLPSGFDVHTPPCFVQKVQSHARAGISRGSGSQSSVKPMLPQWQLP